jgi:UDP-MurNAc hydroxylase
MLGQAATFIRMGGATVLTDPWFSGRAHLGSWQPYPDWTGRQRARLRARCDGADFVYVSHAHEDHFDPEFLFALRPKTILVGDFASQRFRAALRQLQAKHRICYLRHGEAVTLSSGVSATIFLEQPPFRTNSILWLRSPEASVVDANDCGLDSAVLEQIAAAGPPTAFLYTLNFVANGYPFPYLRRDHPDLAGRMRAVRDEIVGSFRTALELLRPQLSIAFAGPITFADGINDHLDGAPEALDWSQMVRELETTAKVIWPAPGSTIQLAGGKVAASRLRSWPSRGPGIARRAEARDRILTAPPPSETDLIAHAQALADRLGEVLARLPGQRVSTSLVLQPVVRLARIETSPPLFQLLVRPGAKVHRLAASAPVKPPWLAVASLPAILSGFCQGTVDLDALLLSGRARFGRLPDRFDPLLHNLLRFGHDAGCVEALAAWYAQRARAARAETLEIRHAGRTYVVPRFCPHEGEPFDRAEIRDGLLICPRHRWCYDLQTGRCVSGGGADVNLYRGRRELRLAPTVP